MSSVCAADHAAYAPRVGLFARLSAAARWVVRLACAMQGRRIVADLARMDDRMLRDIGLDRSDLRDAAAGAFLDDPTDVLFRRAAERRAAEPHPLRGPKSDAERLDEVAERVSRQYFTPYY